MRTRTFCLRACVEEHRDEARVPLKNGESQGGVAFAVPQVDVRLRVEEQAEHGQLPPKRCVVQGGVPTAIALVEATRRMPELSSESHDVATLGESWQVGHLG